MTIGSELRVREAISTEDRARWDEFVMNDPTATFFHLFAWHDVFESVFRHRPRYLFAERADRVIAVLPLVEMKSRLFGHSVASLPFCAYGGVAGEASAIALLEAEAEAFATGCGAAYLEFRNRQIRHDGWPRQDLYFTFRKELHRDHQKNLEAIPRKQRAMVRKGIKRGLRSVIDGTIDRFFTLYAENVRRHGTPAFSRRYFAVLMERFGDAVEILTVEDRHGQPVSSVLTFYFRDEVMPYYAGDLPAARQLAANDFKYWELMSRAVEKGYRVFDYGRSKLGTGQFSFKKNWGFEPAPLSYEYRLFGRDTVPQKNPLNPKYRTLIALWRKLPLSLANRLGPRIARHLG